MQFACVKHTLKQDNKLLSQRSLQYEHSLTEVGSDEPDLLCPLRHNVVI